MIDYICELCGNGFRSERALLEGLRICRGCRTAEPETVKARELEIRKARRRKKAEYWKAHPEEREEFLAERKRRTDETKIRKYGSLEEAERARLSKQLETLKIKYPDEDWSNVTNVGQIQAVKDRIRESSKKTDMSARQARRNETIEKKYGSLDAYYALSQEKARRTCETRYGVASPLLTEKCTTARKAKESEPGYFEERLRKTEATKIEKYGSLENAEQEKRKAMQATCLEKYRTTSAIASDTVRRKARETKAKKKAEDPDYTMKILEKTRRTKTERHGSLEKAGEAAAEARRRTCLERFGADAPFGCPEVREKAKRTCIEKYGVDNFAKSPGFGEAVKAAIAEDAERFEKENGCTQLVRLISEYGQGFLQLDLEKVRYKNWTFVRNTEIPRIAEYSATSSTPVSHGEKDVLAFLKSVYQGPIVENSKKVIPPLELDMYLPEKNLAIEYNGDFWHSSECKAKGYHEKKAKMCEDKGIRLIQIFECEWRYSKKKIESLLRLAVGEGYSKVGARKCEVKRITNAEARPFNDANHLQGHRDASVTYGLFLDGELQQLMSFSHTSRKEGLGKGNDWEIIRGCPGSNNQVVGGVSRLFKAFVKDYDPDTVFSYCDLNKFDGKGYLALEMEFIGYTGPNKFYVDKSGHRTARNPKKSKELEESCLYAVYGAGSKKFLWRRNGNA